LFFAFENQIDKYLIELNLGLKNVGLYTLLIKIFGLSIIAINAVDDGIRPFIYKDLKEGRETVNKYFNLYIGFGVLVLVLINIIGYNLEYIIKNTEYLVIQEYFFLGSTVFLLIIPVRFFGLLLVYYKESSKLSYITSIKVILLVLLMMFLIPKYKIYGALYALSVSYVVNVLLFGFILFKKVDLLPKIKTIIFIALFLVGSYCIHIYIDSAKKIVFSVIYLVILAFFFIKFYLKDGLTVLKSKTET
jgi:O-antigen/teichoic acid export membrane protein